MARTPTDVDRLADAHLDEQVALDPIFATQLGIKGHDHELPDLSPSGLAAVSTQRQRTLAAISEAHPVDSTDRITLTALREELELAEQIRLTGAEESALNNLASPLQSVRDCFDLMPTATSDDWAVIAARLNAVPAALAGYTESLHTAAARADIRARRQVQAGIGQCADNAGDDGFFAGFVGSAAPADGGELPASTRAELQQGAEAAGAAYVALGEFLRSELLPSAPEADAVGPDMYALYSLSFLGTTIDAAETYAWGLDELARIGEQMRVTAEQILPGTPVRQVMAYLDEDPGRKLHGTDELQSWMQAKSDTAVAELGATHFDIPDAIRTLECRIAPTHTGGIYYTGPSEDLSRPGRMWWSVPEGVTEFSTWRELTAVYHEGVPGHHLQVAQTAYRSDLLNRWRRLASWISGHGEGWALYAEWLMADLGYLDDPAEFLGMLDAQSMRAARVVLDIGIHCQLPAPAEVGGGDWTYEKARAFLSAHSVMPEPVLRFELERYLGWPGQAPSYKIGERFWLQLREVAKASAGSAFDLKTFHRSALDIGSVGLDVLGRAILGDFDS